MCSFGLGIRPMDAQPDVSKFPAGPSGLGGFPVERAGLHFPPVVVRYLNRFQIRREEIAKSVVLSSAVAT